jgi:hypothetical protein
MLMKIFTASTSLALFVSYGVILYVFWHYGIKIEEKINKQEASTAV